MFARDYKNTTSFSENRTEYRIMYPEPDIKTNSSPFQNLWAVRDDFIFRITILF